MRSGRYDSHDYLRMCEDGANGQVADVVHSGARDRASAIN